MLKWNINSTTFFSYVLIYLAIIYFSVYFYMFPNPVIIDQMIFFCVVIVYFLALLSLCFKQNVSVFIVLLNVALFAFIKSAAQPINGLFLFLDDPYYYYAMTLNILYTYSLEPVLASWHWLVSFLPYYPMMHLWTAMVETLIGIPPSVEGMRCSTLFISFLCSLIPIVTYLITTEVTKKLKMGLISAVVVAASSGMVFYQYQQQYFPILFFVLLILFLVKKHQNYVLLGLIVVFALSMSHRASNIILMSIFSLYLVLVLVFPKIARESEKYYTVCHNLILRNDDQKFTLLFTLLVLMAANIFVFHTQFFKDLISVSRDFFLNPFYDFYYQPNYLASSDLIQPLGMTESIYTNLSFMKYVIFLISILGLIYFAIHLLNTQKSEIKAPIVYLYCAVSLLTFTSGLIYMEAISRFYIFLVPIVAIFSSYALVKLHIKSAYVGKFMVLMVVLVLSADFIYAMPPALLFGGQYYVEPPLGAYRSAGGWIYAYDDSDEYQVLAPYVHVIDFFAQKPRGKVSIVEPDVFIGGSKSLDRLPLLIGYLDHPLASISRSFSKPSVIDTKPIEDKFNEVYDNGILKYLL